MSEAAPDPLARRSTCRPIVIMIAGGELGWIIANGLAARVGPLVVIEEPPEARSRIIRRRLRLCGPIATAGQIAQGLVQRLREPARRARLAEIWRTHGLDPQPAQGIAHHRVTSVNNDECRQLLRWLDPAAIAVYGTRIIGQRTLSCVDAPFINYHAGINPAYRGQHPAYWALANGDRENCGVTIHLVDRGVDTGAVLYQARVSFDRADTIATYQHVQAATALPLLARAVDDAVNGRLKPLHLDQPSQLWFPPTLWTYMAVGLRRGVW